MANGGIELVFLVDDLGLRHMNDVSTNRENFIRDMLPCPMLTAFSVANRVFAV